VFSTLLIAAGVLLLAWAFVVWRWSDPFTGLYTRWEQRQLESSFAQTLQRETDVRPTDDSTAPAAPRQPIGELARRFWSHAENGEAIAKLSIDRLGLNVIVVKGTDSGSLKKGPGLDGRTAMPGEGQLVYIAGHRTTYLAPFAQIQSMRRGDWVVIQVPYARFVYRVRGSVIVPADDVSRLRSHGREVVVLQACHPRFFATHRYLVYASPVKVFPRRGAPYRVGPRRPAGA
jgi:sortase A